MTFVKPNRTKIAKPNDLIMTKPSTATWIVNYFKPTGFCLDPCAGENAFYNAMPAPKARLEISEGTDFFEWTAPVDWIITNPPFSIYDAFMFHAMNVSDNIVWFVPMQKAFKNQRLEEAISSYGGLRRVVMLGGGGKHGFPFGFQVGCLHYQRNYNGPIYLDKHYKDWKPN